MGLVDDGWFVFESKQVFVDWRVRCGIRPNLKYYLWAFLVFVLDWKCLQRCVKWSRIFSRVCTVYFSNQTKESGTLKGKSLCVHSFNWNLNLSKEKTKTLEQIKELRSFATNSTFIGCSRKNCHLNICFSYNLFLKLDINYLNKNL